MHISTTTTLALLAGPAAAAETLLGAYILHRHGDRTPKALPPTNLTALGYSQVYASGSYYRSRYLTPTNSTKIRGLNANTVKLSQLAITAPVDNVLQNSAQGFLQALYPPVQTVDVLASGQNVSAPMAGYQLIPVNTLATGAGSEDAGWLQDASSCQNAKASSNRYFESGEYKDLAGRTGEFYKGMTESVNGVIGADQVVYKNAYIVYDIINVATIHNTSIPNSQALTPSALTQLHALANAHEYGLAYNSSDTTRAVSGMQLAGEVLTYLNSTITSKGAKKLGIQFGAYATFLSFFGLADLPKVNADFTGVVEYASSMVFELFTTADVAGGAWPATQDLQVRFLFHNGTAGENSLPTVYPLFGGDAMALSWDDFSTKMGKFAISETGQWCKLCGNSTGSCAAYAPGNDNNNSNNGAVKGQSGSGMSPAVGGVIGAFVTLAVVLGGLVAFMLLGGFRLVSKKRMAAGSQTVSVEPKA